MLLFKSKIDETIFSFCNYFFVSISLYAQNEYLISVNNKLGNKLPYASISWGKTNGISANEKGVAKISNTDQIDTIYASSVGYPIKTLRLKDLPRNGDTILVMLSEQTANLSPITVFCKRKN